MIVILYVIFFIETIFLIYFFKRYKYSYISFSYLIFYFYAQACFMDYLFFNKLFFMVNIAPKLHISITDINFLYTSIMYFFFLMGYSFSIIAFGKHLNLQDYNISKILFVPKDKLHKILYNILIFVFSFIMLFLIFKIIGHSRYEIKMIIGNIFYSISILFSLFLWIFSFFLLKKKSFIFYLFSIIIVVVSMLLYEREFIVVLMFVFFYKYFAQVSVLKFILASVFMILLLFLYKAIYSYFINDVASFSLVLDNLNSFTLSDIDPLTSFLMISDFFNNNIFTDFHLTYLVDSIVHLLKTFFHFEYKTMAQIATSYYTNNEMGTAFSLILEALVNFGYFGPLIIGLLLGYMYIILYKMRYYYSYVIDIIIILISLKLIRTEFAVVMKLYILPILLAWLVFKLFNKKYIIRNIA